MADSIYVIDDYVALGYVQAIREGVLLIQANQTGDWAGAGTWQQPGQEVWQPFIAVPFQGQVGIFSVSTTATISTNTVAQTSLVIAGAMTFVLDSSRIRNVSVSMSSVSSIQAVSLLATLVEKQFVSTTTIVSAGVRVHNSSVSVNSASTLQSTGLKLALVSAVMQAAAQITLTSVHQTNTAFQAQCTFVSAPIVGQLGQLSVQSTHSILFVPNHIERVSSQMNAVAAIQLAAGTIFIGVFNVQAFAAQVAVSELYVIDPERILAVLSESRINIIALETRSQKILSETRKLVVQHNKLVNVAGTPRDRREG